MAAPTKRKLKVLTAKYIQEAKSIMIVGECEEGRFRTQIHREALFPQGIKNTVTEDALHKEFSKFAQTIIGKDITIVFDPDLSERLNSKDVNY